MDRLPLDLLFLNVEKIGLDPGNPGYSAVDSWMPLYPGDGLLNSEASMVRDECGLVLNTRTPAGLRVIKIDSLRESARRFALSSYVEVPGTSLLDNDGEELWVSDYDRRGGQTLHHSNMQHETYIIFHDNPGQMCAGARLIVNRIVDKSIYLRYDCAVQVSRQDGGSGKLPQVPCLRARRQPADSSLVLDNSRPSEAQATPGPSRRPSDDTAALRLPRRPPNYIIENIGGTSTIAFLIGVIGWAATLTSVILFGIFVIRPYPDEKLRRVGTVVFTLLCYWSSIHWFLLPYDIAGYVVRWMYLKQWAATFDKEWEPQRSPRSPWVRYSANFFRVAERILQRLVEFLLLWPILIVGFGGMYCMSMPFALVWRLLKHDGRPRPWGYWLDLPPPLSLVRDAVERQELDDSGD